MDKQNLRKILQDKVQGHEEYLDKVLLWKNIQQKKKRRRTLFWLKLIAPLIMGSLIFYSFYKQNENKKAPEIFVNAHTIKNEKASQSVLGSSINDELYLAKDKVASDKSKNIAQTKTSIVDDKISIRPESNPNKKILNLDLEKASPSTLETSIEDNREKSLNDPTSHLSETIIDNSTVFITNDVLDTKSFNDIKKKVSTSKAKNQNQNLLSDNKSSRNSSLINYLGLIKLEQLKIEQKEFSWNHNNDGFIMPPPKTESIEKYSLGITSGYSFINKTLNSTPLNNDIVSHRNSIEDPLENISIGLMFSYKTKFGVYINGGLEWHRLVERINTEEYIVNKVIEDDVLIYELRLLDNTIESQFGQAEVSFDTLRTYNVYNEYNRVNIPLGIGYEKRFKNWSFFSDINIQLNVNNKFSGYLLGQDFRLRRNPLLFKERIDLVPFASLGVRYQWNNGISFSISPFIELKKWEVNNSLNPIDQQYRLYGFRSSLMYHF